MSDYHPDLDAIMRTDRFVDALASGARMSSVDPLSSMLGSWRDDVRREPDAPVVTLAQAEAALAAAQKPLRRNRFGLTIIGAAAAAVLGLGGFGAVVYDANPGDALYGLRTMLFGEQQNTREAAVTLASQELAQVQQLVQEGKWDQAQEKLMTLSTTVQSVDDVQDKQQLVEQYNSLAAKVIQKNPDAAAPPPGEPPPVNPSSPLTFLQVPVVEPTTTSPSVPDAGSTTVPTSLPSPTSVPTSLPTPTPTTTLPTTTPPTTAPPTSPAPTTTVPSSTAPAPTPTPTTILRTTVSTAPPSMTSPQVQGPPPSASPTITTPDAPQPTEGAPTSPTQSTRVPANQRTAVVTTPEGPGRR